MPNYYTNWSLGAGLDRPIFMVLGHRELDFGN